MKRKGKQLHTRPELKDFRRKLRNNLTPAEAFLWKHIKARKLEGKRFNRQHSIGPYIVDFYCAEYKLVIELDGEFHNDPIRMDYDFRRAQYLESLGFTVIRFENKMVFENLASVFSEIGDYLK